MHVSMIVMKLRGGHPRRVGRRRGRRPRAPIAGVDESTFMWLVRLNGHLGNEAIAVHRMRGGNSSWGGVGDSLGASATVDIIDLKISFRNCSLTLQFTHEVTYDYHFGMFEDKTFIVASGCSSNSFAEAAKEKTFVSKQYSCCHRRRILKLFKRSKQYVLVQNN